MGFWSVDDMPSPKSQFQDSGAIDLSVKVLNKRSPQFNPVSKDETGAFI